MDAPLPSRALRKPAPAGFNVTQQMRLVCQDMVDRLPDLAHVDLRRVAVSFSQARAAHGHGLQATLTPLRFESGSLTTLRRGRRYTLQRLFDSSGVEYLYILSFYLPRFLNHPLHEKVVTILHELWHISPAFDGDLRRFAGRCYAHGPSQKRYDRHVEELAARWLAVTPPAPLHRLLELNFEQLQRRYGSVYGVKIPGPKLIPAS